MDSYSVGFLVGVCLVFFCLLWLGIYLRKHRTRYDERQELVRGRGYKYAYFTLLIYELLYWCIIWGGNSAIDSFLEPKIGFFLGLCISVLVYAVYCILNDGYYGINEHWKTTMFGFGILGFINLFAALTNRQELIVDGKAGDYMMNLICGVMILVVVFTSFLKFLKDKKKFEQEDDE